MEVERKVSSEVAAIERLKNWREFKIQSDEKQLRSQGSRCMDCGTPFCHTGHIISGMASGCPINNLIPEWNDLVYRGRWREALDRLHKTNNFPEFTGRVCPAPCESACVLGVIQPPVTIKNIEAAIIDRGFEEGWVLPRIPQRRTGKKVLVVGSGPAGLSCADQLNQAGHHVTVMEREDRIGGLLMYGIPNMKLDKELVVQRRVDLLEEEGIEFKTGISVGHDADWTVERIRKEFDAVVLCCGATYGRDLEIPGRNAKGIYLAMDFLTDNTRHQLDHAFNGSNPVLNATGKDVVVIGGGDTGTDCVGTSLRHGCRSVVQLEIMPKPPESRAANNPWPEWAKVYKMDYGQEEAAALQGQDPRQYLVQTQAFIHDAEGQLTHLEVADIIWDKNEKNQFVPKEVDGTRRTIPCQLALLAMGFAGPEQKIISQFALETDARTNVKADHDCYQTNVPGVFAAGDMRRGQSLVVWAINEGRGAARECDRYLMGVTQLP